MKSGDGCCDIYGMDGEQPLLHEMQGIICENLMGGECYECGGPATCCCMECDEIGDPVLFCDEHYAVDHGTLASCSHTGISYEFVKNFSLPVYSETTEAALEFDQRENTFITLDFETNRLQPGLAFFLLTQRADFNKRKEEISCIGFLGESGNGKSFLIRNLIPNAKRLPCKALPNSQTSTSSDFHAYYHGEFTGDNNGVVVFDSEGLKGSEIPNQLNRFLSHGTPSSKMIESRKKLIQQIFPRLLYTNCDVICCPFSGSVRDTTPCVELLEFSSLGCSRLVNEQNLPSLVIIFNKQQLYDCHRFLHKGKVGEWDGFSSVLLSTQDWLDTFPCVADELKLMFENVFVVYVPDAIRYPLQAFVQLELFRAFVSDLAKDHKRNRKAPKNLGSLGRMFKIAKTIHETPNAEIDGSLWYNQGLSLGFSTESALKTHWLSIYEKFGFVEGYEKFKDIVARAYGFRKYYANPSLTWPENELELENFLATWKPEIQRISEQVMNFAPCSSEMTFVCAEKGKFTATCQQHKAFHGRGHKSMLTYKFCVPSKIVTSGERACTWPGEFSTSYESLGEDLLLHVCSYIMNNRPLTQFGSIECISDSDYCNLCFSGRSTVTLTCSHSVCERCYDEIIQQTSRCMFCKQKQISRSLRAIPKFSGLRVLSLDGGGIPSFVSLKLLHMFEQRSGIPIKDLFDLIIGTDCGGLLGTYLGGFGKYSKQVNPGFICSTVEECAKMFDGVVEKTLESKRTIHKVSQSLTAAVRRMPWGLGAFLGEYVPQSSVSIYDNSVLEKSLQQYLPQSRLRGSTNSAPLIVTTTTLLDHYDRPRLASNSFIPNMSSVNDGECSVISAVMRSIAISPYFAPCEGYVNGGILASCPSNLALEICKNMWPEKKLDILLSIGYDSSPKNCISSGPLTVNLSENSKSLAEQTRVSLENLSYSNLGSPFERLTLPIPGDIDMYDCSPEELKQISASVDDWMINNQQLVNSVLARLVGSCILISGIQRDHETTKTITITLSPREEVQDKISPDLWELEQKSVQVNGDVSYPKTIVRLSNPDRYDIVVPISDQAQVIAISVHVKTPFGMAFISGGLESGDLNL